MLICFLLHYKNKPNDNEILNTLESLSLVASGITIYLGKFLLNGNYIFCCDYYVEIVKQNN